jgi:hypothetical protein
MQLLYLQVVPHKALSVRSCTVLVASLADFEASLELILRVHYVILLLCLYTSYNKFKVLMRVLFSFTRKCCYPVLLSGRIALNSL